MSDEGADKYVTKNDRIAEVVRVMGVDRHAAMRALSASHWDIAAAMDWLRRNTPTKASKKRGG